MVSSDNIRAQQAATLRGVDLTGRQREIVECARAIAEREGWDAVTTRRLSRELGFTQPILYRAFASRQAIVDAVAVAGFADFARSARAALAHARVPGTRLTRLAQAYLDFEEEQPAVYEAMFSHRSTLPFGQNDTPAELRSAFELLSAELDGDIVRTELAWSTLHGLATLSRAGRINAQRRREHVAAFVRSMLPAG